MGNSDPGEAPYVPKNPTINPNISDRPPLLQFLSAAAIVLGVAFVAYLALGAFAGWAAARLPYELEASLGDQLVGWYGDFSTDQETEARLQILVDALADGLEDYPLPIQVHLVDSEMVNAAALPGGHILVFQALLDEAGSENEIAMILGHEIGHLVGRHHVRALGRRVVIATVASVIFQSDTLANRVIMGSMDTAEQNFSRRQETAADLLGLDLLQQHYGHVGGALDFFDRHREGNEFVELFSSHPLSSRRIEALQSHTSSRGYPTGATISWSVATD